MSLKMISVISKAEEEALQAILITDQKAREAVDEARTAGEETVSATLARAESEIAHMMRVSDHKATEEAKELASATANRLATMRARAERRLDAAARQIVERIVSA